MKKRSVLSLVLALALCLSLVPAGLAADTATTYSQPILENMANWNLREQSDRKGIGDGERFYYIELWDSMEFLGASEKIGLNVDIPAGATQVTEENYNTLSQWMTLAGRFNPDNVYPTPDEAQESIHQIITLPMAYYLTSSGYQEYRYEDNYGDMERLFFKDGDVFIIPGWEKNWNSWNNQSGFLSIVHYHVDAEVEETTTHVFTGEKPSSWAQGAVGKAIEVGLVPTSLQSGYTKAITRAEFCALAVQLIEWYWGSEISGRETFTDTTDENVEKAAYLGIVNGVGEGRFNPGASLTREQAATMLSRLYTVATGYVMQEEALTFADTGSISAYATQAVGQMGKTGVMGGVGNNTFSPKGSYTREQSIITIMRMYRMMTYLEGQPDFAVEEPVEVDEVSYAAIALDYVYRRLKVPSSMEVIDIRGGHYDRVEFYEGAPDFVKPTHNLLSYTDDYYVITMKIKAMNSVGAMVTDSYVFLFNLTTGESIYDMINYASDRADGAWGASKIAYMDLESEALLLAAADGYFQAFSRETVEKIVEQVTK